MKQLLYRSEYLHESTTYCKCPSLVSISRVYEALSKIRSVSINNAALSKSTLHVHESQRNVTKDYRKLVVNKLCERVLLPDGCTCFEVKGQAANANWDSAGRSKQPLRSTMRARGQCWIWMVDTSQTVE